MRLHRIIKIFRIFAGKPAAMSGTTKKKTKSMSTMMIDETNMCSHQQHEPFDLQIERIKSMEQRFNKALAAIKDESAVSLKAIEDDVAELSKYYSSELWKEDFAADEAGILPPDLKCGVLSEDGIWNLLSDYRDIQKKKRRMKNDSLATIAQGTIKGTGNSKRK